MKKKIIIEIDCDEKHCGDCDGEWGGATSIPDDAYSWCRIYDAPLYAERRKGILRCSECLKSSEYLIMVSDAFAAAQEPNSNKDAQYELELFFDSLQPNKSV